MDEMIWPVVKQLAEQTDSTGTVHRDRALRKAVKRCRWDVVEHCTNHGADIDKTDKKGARSCRKRSIYSYYTRDEIVGGLLHQGADQFRLDKHGFSVLAKDIRRGGV
ncbi:hypothetical protein BaRGS_00006449 [Batillaria attramentaria]|uniref:Ankyrin repeat protein n=1 Tax=Batillaria attramentaria TaxID=370345 RepID=A0ABD0LSM8_9CAEN